MASTLPLQEFGALAVLAGSMMSLVIWIVRRLLTSQQQIVDSAGLAADHARVQLVEAQREFLGYMQETARAHAHTMLELSTSLQQLARDIRAHDERQTRRDRELLEALRRLNGHDDGEDGGQR